jgi:hypothetical protein
VVAGAQQRGPGDLVDVVERVAELGHRLHDVVAAPPSPSSSSQVVYLRKD